MRMEPTEIATLAAKIFGILCSVIGGIIAAYKWAYKKGLRDGRSTLTYTHDRNTLEHLYAPLVAQLMDTHLSACSSIMYNSFRQRFKRALGIFQERRYFSSKIKSGFVALFDRGVSGPTVGLEYGSRFPTTEIGEVIKKHAHLAPPELVTLYKRVVREEHEQELSSDGILSLDHLKLAEYIFEQHEFLANRIRFVKA